MQSYINSLIVNERDYNIDYFGFKTLEQSYFSKNNNQIIETPQYLWMRLASFIHYKDNDLEAIKETAARDKVFADQKLAEAKEKFINAKDAVLDKTEKVIHSLKSG